jgi:hypothetical protein
MTPAMREAADSQEEIGWTEFLHRKVSLKITQMLESFGILAGCKLSGKQWTKQLVERLIHISHSQWLFRCFSLHHKTKGYLSTRATTRYNRRYRDF